MPLLNTADKVYLGDTPVDTVYAGSTVVWSNLPVAGLKVWLDAAVYTGSTWPNSGSGPVPAIVGTPPMTKQPAVLNGLPVVRFKANEGRVRGDWSTDFHTFTVIYLVRYVGPTAGRAFSTQYPPSNFLVGMHAAARDSTFDNGAWVYGPTITWWVTPPPGPWRMYEAASQAGVGLNFYINGTLIGTSGGVGGLTNGWGLSGYDAVGAMETIDMEVAEFLLWDRKLPDAERQEVESYLRSKWGLPPPLDPDTQAYLTATGLDPSFAPALDGLVKGLKTYGLWTKMNAIYPFIGGTADLHKWNLKDPRDLDAAYRLTFRAGTHSLALGYQPNLAISDAPGGGRADTYLVPLDTLAQNSTHLSLYSLASKPVGPRCDMGCYNWPGAPNARFHVIAYYVGNLFYYGMSEQGFSSNRPVPDSTGLFVATRTGATAQAAYRNGVSLGTSTPPSVALPNISVHIGEISGYDREYSDLPVGFASIGSGLTDQNNADLYTVVQGYQTALGRAI